MRRFLIFLSLSILFPPGAIRLKATALPDAAQTWSELRNKREALKSFHQEFETSRTIRTPEHNQASKWSIVVDYATGRWREQSAFGAGGRVTVFDGKDLLEFEEDGDEYTRLKHSSNGESPQPTPYSSGNLNLSKAVERDRQSCGLTKVDHQCVVIDIPLKPWIHVNANSTVQMTGGSARIVLDTATGLLISSRLIENIENSRTSYQSDTTYILKQMTYGGEADENIFHLPLSALKEVRELPRWNAERMKKRLAGKPAPDLVLTDLRGQTFKLSDFKGRTVLLDFWATWCGPCRADGPSLDELYKKYHEKNLTIIGVSVNEDRAVVEKFLSQHPHPYAIALTTENEMPRQYRIGVFPTYVVIDPEGNLASASEGEKGFSELRKILKKAGLDAD